MTTVFEQSLGLEFIGLVLANKVFLEDVSGPLIDYGLKRLCPEDWAVAKEASSERLGTVKDEATFKIALALHHFVAGSLILWSVDGALHGLLLELAFEIVDLERNVLRIGPYASAPSAARRTIACHHMFGVLCIIPGLMYDVFASSYVVRLVAGILMAAGSIELFATGINAVISAQKHPKKILAIQCLCFLNMLFARFVMLPFAAIKVIFFSGIEFPSWVYCVLLVALICMAHFSMSLVPIHLGKMRKTSKFLFEKKSL